MDKLEIQIVNGSRAGQKFKVLFNPEEYTVNTDNNFAVQGIPGLPAPLIQFVNGNMRTLDMELFLDTWDSNVPPSGKGDVRDLCRRITGLMEIDSDLHAPPVLNLSWASLQFQCVLAKVTQKFIMFADDGKPVRARLTCTFNEIVDPEQAVKQANPQTADYSKLHIVAQGETLSGIAGKLYNDPRSWRPIAVANGIADTRSLFPGQPLRIPSLPFIDPDTREVVD